jgi:hypothetical protein
MAPTKKTAPKKPAPKKTYTFKPSSTKNLQASYDAIPKKQTARAAQGLYSTRNDAKRKQVSRYMQKQVDAGLSVKGKPASHTKFFASVKKVHKTIGCEAAMAYVTKNVQTRVIFKGKGARIIKNTNTMALIRRHDARKNPAFSIGHQFGFDVDLDDIEWHIWLNNTVPLFVIKKSGVPNSGLGLFAAQHFDEGEVVSLYCGVNQGIYEPKRLLKSDKAISDKNGVVYTVSDKVAFLGFHFANDPMQSKPLLTNPPEYNVKVLPGLLCEALADIEVGDEILMEYNMTDTDTPEDTSTYTDTPEDTST